MQVLTKHHFHLVDNSFYDVINLMDSLSHYIFIISL